MYSPTTRLLAVLEMLQSRAQISGPELAERLEVDVRSVRRYITMLRDMGIPVDSEPGRYGAYSLRPGFRLPPLMFTEPEILAVILGLMAVRTIGLAATPGVESALAKIERVLPEELGERVRAVQGALTLNMPVNHATGRDTAAGDLIARFSVAAYQRRQVWMAYQARESERSERVIDVYGLVYHAGSWYAAAHCHLRDALRTFRLDRVQQSRLLETTFEAPPEFDPLAYVLRSLASLPGLYSCEVLLETSLDEAERVVPQGFALLDPVPAGVLLRCWVTTLDWFARMLVNFGCPFVIIGPEELRVALRRLAGWIESMTEREGLASGG